MEEIQLEKISWFAPEYSHKERHVDWYWTIGLVTVASAATAIYFKNYLFSVFLVLACGSLMLFNLRRPKEVEFIIETEGLTFGRDVHTWKSIKGFNIKKGDPYAKLLILTDKNFLPTYTLPMPKEYTVVVRENLLKIIPAIDIEESPSMMFMEKLGF